MVGFGTLDPRRPTVPPALAGKPAVGPVPFSLAPAQVEGGAGVAAAVPVVATEPTFDVPDPGTLGLIAGSLTNRLVAEPLQAARNLGRTIFTGEPISIGDVLAVPAAGSVFGALAGPRGGLAMGGARRAPPTTRTIEGQGPNMASVREAARLDDNNSVETVFRIARQSALDRPQVDIDFQIRDIATGLVNTGTTGRQAGLTGRQGMRALSAVESSVDNFIRQVQPSVVRFNAARRELVPLYSRVARRIAKEFGGEATEDRQLGMFEVLLRSDQR